MMYKSESIAALAKALSQFQGEIKNPNNTADNPFFKSKYAPLNDILNLVRPVLSKHGLSIVQAPSGDGENIIIFTTLIHSSGEWIEFEPLTLKADKVTAQGAGSAITYGRRYALSAVLGISSEDDDDGNGAEPKKANKDNKSTQQNNKQSDKTPKASKQLLDQMYDLVKVKKVQDKVIDYIADNFNKTNSKDMTADEVKKTIEWLKAE
jgi:hypothetical protein